MILAMDTATEQASVAIFDEESLRIVAEHSWLSSRRHTVELMPRVDELMREAGLTPWNLSGIAVAIGPGSYTGLRIALSAAKGIVAVTDAPLLGVPTLDITAYPHQAQNLPILALLQAGRRRVCWALYRKENDRWTTDRGYNIGEPEEMAASMKGKTLLVGEITHVVMEALDQNGVQYSIALPGTHIRRAGYLAAIAAKRMASGDVDDPAALSPLYLPRSL